MSKYKIKKQKKMLLKIKNYEKFLYIISILVEDYEYSKYK